VVFWVGSVEPALKKSGASSRSLTIDAFRGIAAAGVMVQHLLLSWSDPIVKTWHAAVYYTPLEALFSDGKFIRIFFVLSGFVMFLPFERKTSFSWSQFYSRRFWRIYPAFAAAVLISIIVHFLIVDPHAVQTTTAWFAVEGHSGHVTWELLLQLLCFTGTAASIKINCVTWSLVEEVRVILLFPILAYCVRLSGTATLATTIFASIIATAAYPIVGETGYFITAESSLGAVCATLHFLPLFVIGMVMAQRLDLFSDVFARSNVWQRSALWFLAFVLVRRQQEYIAGFAAALLIFLSMRTHFVSRALQFAPLLWLGRISYSLYLIHMPIIVATLHVLDGIVPIEYALLAAGINALAIANLFANLIEHPFIERSRHPSPRAVPQLWPTHTSLA
jgi:peptidoglycan/LPS O-acetylase OafA/YrhL